MNSSTIIIAEAGVNHNGDVEIGKKLIEAAAQAGADYVKFQTFKASKVASGVARKASYQAENMNDALDDQVSMLKKLELSYQMHEDLFAHCEKFKIKFLSTGFDNESVDYLMKFNPDFCKVPSGDITNKPYLQHIASKRLPVIISTGMCDMSDIKGALNVLESSGLRKSEIIVLHCNTQYPTPMQDVNLLAMNTIGRTFGVPFGYSDHTNGIEVPIAAVALGAVVIEKHFTLNREMEGPDHAASLEPSELTAMIAAIRNIETALGGKEKICTASEYKNRAVARRSIHLNRAMRSGETVNANDLIMLRPGDGITPMDIDDVVGKKINNDLVEFHKLELADLQ